MQHTVALRYIWLALVVLCGLESVHGDIAMQVLLGGTDHTSVTVAPVATINLDVVAESITAGGDAEANLDAFTYRLLFSNEQFALTGNTFIAPFDNTLAPGGFNGSVPWYDGVDVPINNGADAGSPGSTGGVADLYRTTATLAGVPVTGPDDVLEQLSVIAPLTGNVHSITLEVLEAVDMLGEFHPVSNDVAFMVTIPQPATASMLILAGVTCTTRRRTLKRPTLDQGLNRSVDNQVKVSKMHALKFSCGARFQVARQ